MKAHNIDYIIYWVDSKPIVYSYNMPVTQEYDAIDERDFTLDDIYRLTLWKVDRYPYLQNSDINILQMLNAVKGDQVLDKIKTQELLQALLHIRGIRLPMASTYLRFRNPHIYQIIDKRVCRYLYNDINLLNKIATKSIDEQIELYLTYLTDIREKARELQIAFEEADRVLYQLDKDNHTL